MTKLPRKRFARPPVRVELRGRLSGRQRSEYIAALAELYASDIVAELRAEESQQAIEVSQERRAG